MALIEQLGEHARLADVVGLVDHDEVGSPARAHQTQDGVDGGDGDALEGAGFGVAGEHLSRHRLVEVAPQRLLELLDQLLHVRDDQHSCAGCLLEVSADHLPANDGLSQPSGEHKQRAVWLAQVGLDRVCGRRLVVPELVSGRDARGHLLEDRAQGGPRPCVDLDADAGQGLAAGLGGRVQARVGDDYRVVCAVARPGALCVIDPGAVDGSPTGELALQHPLLAVADREDVGALVAGAVDDAHVGEAKVPRARSVARSARGARRRAGPRGKGSRSCWLRGQFAASSSTLSRVRRS